MLLKYEGVCLRDSLTDEEKDDIETLIGTGYFKYDWDLVLKPTEKAEYLLQGVKGRKGRSEPRPRFSLRTID